MSLFLRFASVISPRRTISCAKKFYRTNHSFTFRERLGILYFLPRTTDSPSDIRIGRMKDRNSVPEEFKLIYSFSDEDILTGVSYVALGFAFIFVLFLIKPTILEDFNESLKKEENEFDLEEPILQDEYTSSETAQKIQTVLDSISESEVFQSGDPRAKALLGLSMIIFFLYVKSRCVLTIYRHKNDFITVLGQPLGSGKTFIKHKANDCCYYPKRKWFSHNLMGKDVIIFPELFVSSEERHLYNGKIRE